MIIPIKCFTCGKVLANKYRYYCLEVKQKKFNKQQENIDIVYLTNENQDKSPEAEVLDSLQLFDICCRRHMLTHVDI